MPENPEVKLSIGAKKEATLDSAISGTESAFQEMGKTVEQSVEKAADATAGHFRTAFKEVEKEAGAAGDSLKHALSADQAEGWAAAFSASIRAVSTGLDALSQKMAAMGSMGAVPAAPVGMPSSSWASSRAIVRVAEESKAAAAEAGAAMRDEAEKTGEKVKEEADTAGKHIEKMMSAEKIGAVAEQLAGKMREVGRGMLEAGKYSLDTAEKFETYRIQLENVMKDQGKAEETMAFVRAEASRSPYQVGELTQATVQLEMFQNSAKRFLPLAQDLASYMRKDLGESTLAFSKALSGSQEGFESLRNEFGISTPKLAAFGAEVSKQGQILLQNEEQIKKAKEALTEYVQKTMGGSTAKLVDTFTGQLSMFNDAVTRLAESLGKELLPKAKDGIQVATALVNQLNKLPPVFKTVAADGVVLAGVATLAAANLLSMGAQVSQIVISLGGWSAVTAGAATGWASFAAAAETAIGGTTALAFGLSALGVTIVPGLVVAAVAGAAKIRMMRDETLALEAQMATEEVQVKRLALSYTEDLANAKKAGAKSTEDIIKALEAEGWTIGKLQLAYQGIQILYREVATIGGATAAQSMKFMGGLRDQLHDILGSMGDMQKKAQEVAATAIAENAVQEQKRIEHDLKMGWLSAQEAASQYSNVIALLNAKLQETGHTEKEIATIQNELWKAEERQKEIRDKDASKTTKEATAKDKQIEESEKAWLKTSEVDQKERDKAKKQQADADVGTLEREKAVIAHGLEMGWIQAGDALKRYTDLIDTMDKRLQASNLTAQERRKLEHDLWSTQEEKKKLEESTGAKTSAKPLDVSVTAKTEPLKQSEVDAALELVERRRRQMTMAQAAFGYGSPQWGAMQDLFQQALQQWEAIRSRAQTEKQVQDASAMDDLKKSAMDAAGGLHSVGAAAKDAASSLAASFSSYGVTMEGAPGFKMISGFDNGELARMSAKFEADFNPPTMPASPSPGKSAGGSGKGPTTIHSTINLGNGGNVPGSARAGGVVTQLLNELAMANLIDSGGALGVM